MKIMMLLFGLMAFFTILAAANIDRSCDCTEDTCIDPSAPPGNTTCFVSVPTDASDTDPNDSDGYAYQACGNASYADLSDVGDYGVQANISSCIQVMEDMSNPSYVFLASQLYNTSALAVALFQGCYLWVLGGENATAEVMDVNDTFFVGNMDFVFALGNAIINYSDDDGVNGNMAVCGTIPGCNFYNSLSGSTPPTVPDFAWCLGGEYIVESWVQHGGSFGHDMASSDDLPSEQFRKSQATRSPSAIPELSDKNTSTEDESADLIDRSSLEPRSRDWFIRCDAGDRTLAQCTQLYETYCDDAGRLHSDDVTCRFDCSCFPVPRARCGLHYGFIYDCYDEEPERTTANSSVGALEPPPQPTHNS